MKKLLIQTQLSNYDANRKFILEADSGWQMTMGRVRQMLKLNPELSITVMGPEWYDTGECPFVTHPFDINPDLWEKYGTQPGGECRLFYVGHRIIPNAIVTRYDFNWTHVALALDLGMHKHDSALRYDAALINDPMHLRNFKTMFHVVGGYSPRFYVHSHFVDSPSCPKFDPEVSLWLGQVEASIKADWNFWQCSSALKEFESEARKLLQNTVVDDVMKKSEPWDDGYSIEEITSEVDLSQMRFTPEWFHEKTKGKIVIFVPNRIGGKGRSSDYTNCGKFMFELLPQLYANRKDEFVIIAGNPSQKFSNAELENECSKYGFLNVVTDSLNRNEFKFIAANSHISLGMYDQDTYGGTVARECVELGCLPFWLNTNEYKTIANDSKKYFHLSNVDFSDFVTKLGILIEHCKMYGRESSWVRELQTTVRAKCAYENTTASALERMQLSSEV